MSLSHRYHPPPPPGIQDSTEGFESGSFSSGWTEYGDSGGWYATSEDAAEGNYSIRSYSGFFGYEYLVKTITVPQYSEVFISFWGKGVNDGDDNNGDASTVHLFKTCQHVLQTLICHYQNIM